MTNSEQDMFPDEPTFLPGGIWSSKNVDPEFEKAKGPPTHLAKYREQEQPRDRVQVEMRLHNEEFYYAGFVGVKRRVNGFGKDGADGARREDAWDRDFLGAIGEYALAKYLGVPWDGGKIGVYTESDVGHLEVRSTYWGNGKLIVRTTDFPEKANKPFVLMTAQDFPVVWLRGWLVCHEAKIRGEWGPLAPGRKNSWNVDQLDLNPMWQLLTEKAGS